MTRCPAHQDAARSVYAAVDALNEVMASAVALGLQVDLRVLETTALPTGRLPQLHAAVSSPIPRNAR